MSEEQTMVQKAFAQIGERFDGIEKLLKREKEGSVRFSGVAGSALYSENSENTKQNFTFSLWCKTLNNPTSGLMIKYGNGSGWGMGFGSQRANTDYIGSNFVYLYEAYSWKNSAFTQDKTLWHHYAISRNGSSFRYYLDGSIYVSDTQSSFKTGLGWFYIGSGSGSSGGSENRSLPCNITRVSFWNRTLSAAEIASDFTDGKNAPSITNGLEHYWPMSTQDNYLQDKVGSANLTIGVASVTISQDTPFA